MKTLKRIITGFIIVLGGALISYVFFEKEAYDTINKNIGRTIWIGLMLMLTLIGAALSQSYFERRAEAATRHRDQDPTTYKYLNYLCSFLIYFVGIGLAAVAIPALRNAAASALAGAGVMAIVVGVASQEGISNIVGGMFIIFFKPFRIGEIVRVNDNAMGRVEDINLRHTVIKNFQNKRIVIPNAIMNKEHITNYSMTEHKTCEWIEVGISYDSDIDKAIELMRDEAMKHPYQLDQRTEKEKENDAPEVDVQVIGLGDSSVNLRAWVWSASFATGFKMRNQLYKNIKERFDAEGITIPFPQRTLHLKTMPDVLPKNGKLQVEENHQ